MAELEGALDLGNGQTGTKKEGMTPETQSGQGFSGLREFPHVPVKYPIFSIRLDTWISYAKVTIR